MARREFPRKVKAAAIARAAGVCERCKAALKPGEAEIDHILPCELGGEPTLINAQTLCRVCHSEKTATDIRRMRKAERARDKSSGAIRPKQTIRSGNNLRTKERTPKQPLPPRPIYTVSLAGRGELMSPIGGTDRDQ